MGGTTRRERRLLRRGDATRLPYVLALRARAQLRPAHGRVPVDRRRARLDRCSTCSRSAPRTGCSRSSSCDGVGAGLFGFQHVAGRSRPGCRSSSSRCSSGSRWTTRCSCSAGSGALRRDAARRARRSSSGVASTARIITGAALIIVAVFAGFAAGRARHVPADGLRRRRRAPDRRHDHPLGPRCRRARRCSASGAGTCRAGSTGSRTSRSSARSRTSESPPDVEGTCSGFSRSF